MLLGIILFLLLGMLYLYSDFLFMSSKSEVSTNETTFEKQEWQKGNERSRGAMTNDIIGSDTLLNETESTVVELLGTPDLKNDSLLIYNVDMGDDMSISGDSWPYNLIVKLSADSSKKVENVSLAD